MQSLINLLTADQIKAAKGGRIVWLTNAAQRNSITKLGYQVVKEDRRNSRLHYDVASALSKHLNSRSKAKTVVSVEDRYNDSMGAFEVVHLLDDNGLGLTVSNVYDTATCFRLMSHAELLAYVNART